MSNSVVRLLDECIRLVVKRLFENLELQFWMGGVAI